MSVRLQLTTAVIFLAAPSDGVAWSYEWALNLGSVGHAVQAYRAAHGALPADFELRSRKFSWRVAILPYLDNNVLHERILAGGEAAPNAPVYFLNVLYSRPDPKRSYVVALRGPDTAWSQARKELHRDPARTALLVGVPESEAPIWYEPRDLDYNSTEPRRGLDWSDGPCFPLERVCFVVLADGTSGMIRESVDDEFLRRLFAADGEPPQVKLNWLEAMAETPLGPVIAGALLYGIVAIAGIVLFIFHLCRRQTVSPGELLWLILGVHQLVYLGLFTSLYEYHHVFRQPLGKLERELWFYPALAASLTASLALVRFWRFPGWRRFFIALLILLGLDTLDASWSMPYPRAPEESLVTSVPTMVSLLAGVVGAVFTHRIGIPGEKPRACAHWCGIVLMLLPMVWYCYWSAHGGIQPRHWFVRVRY